MTYVKQLIGMFFLVIVVCGGPFMLYTQKEEIVFEPGNIVVHTVYLIQQIAEGSLGTYYSGQTERSIAEDILPFAISSFELLFASVGVAVLASIIFGLLLQRFRIVRQFQKVLNLLATIPDFILIVVSIVGAVGFYKLTNIRIITLSPISDSESTWFPITLLSIGPTIFLMKVVSLKYVQIGGEDYIKTALAKGMGIWHVLIHHVYKNIKPFLIADLKKTIAITVANLFIVEYLLNVVGLTRFIFSKDGGYEFNAAVMGLLGIILLSILVYVLIRLILYVIERAVVYK
ncbi:ABC transporter permease subunit [Brevibacillus sp. HB1.2]|uniref:ABC transporter permease subunit n=1 Tax=Brevibacillus TaxID=55080 RepID=UPI000382BF02|nr:MULTISPECIES: ABC transporter permease subunit [unclassified Brevibacillus]ATF12281.1 ABC transporter permease [Brevibacillus brevis X23]MDC0763518.1 ABC transporter permease subunit [Brevibacillus sp. AG]NRS16525.1 ABC transporter permease subunit [Brevibacillus sp. HB1.4B]NTU20568.1 ABC transporter permease subunit [Brevibacillus sp. HB1.2]NTU34240.1 ABC transporter permease subunit [Brevibacillus sp. HB1.1]